MSERCSDCNTKLGGRFGATPSKTNPTMCMTCSYKRDNRAEQASAAHVKEALDAQAEELAKTMRLTTAFTVAGAEIETELDIVTAECAFGMNVFRDLFAGLRDVVGGRSEATQKVLRDARKTCLEELKKEAALVGADAVIGVDLDYSELSGGNKSMLFLVASGTAVKLKK